MNHHAVEGEIKKLEAEVAALTAQQQNKNDQLQQVLRQPADMFDASAAGSLKRDLAAIAERTALAVDRIEALEATRPTADQRAEAEDRARLAIEQVATSGQVFTSALAQYREALDAAVGIAIEMINARALGRHAVIEARELVATYGLSIRVPEAPSASPREEKLARLLTRFLADAIVDVPDQSLQYEIAAARSEAVLV